jgi:AraC-like DNA-binding protein
LIRAIDPPPPDFGLMRLSSNGLPLSDRFELWRDLVTRKLMRLSIDRLTDEPFWAEAMLRSQHGLTIGVGEIGPSLNCRTSDIVANDNDDLVLMANLSGAFLAEVGGEEQTLEPGEAVLVSCAQVGRYVRPTSGKLLCARLPRQVLARLTPDPERRTGRLIGSDNGALHLLIGYAGVLWQDDRMAVDPQVSRSVVDHICDLVALCAGASGDAAEFAAGRGARAAKLKAVKACIEAKVGPHEFSIDDVAAEVGVSPRYVRKLLEAEGDSFSRFVTKRRLARAYALLSSPRRRGLSVATIAYDVGFGDLSYFNRMFRRAYDCTPSDVRACN